MSVAQYGSGAQFGFIEERLVKNLDEYITNPIAENIRLLNEVYRRTGLNLKSSLDGDDYEIYEDDFEVSDLPGYDTFAAMLRGDEVLEGGDDIQTLYKNVMEIRKALKKDKIKLELKLTTAAAAAAAAAVENPEEGAAPGEAYNIQLRM